MTTSADLDLAFAGPAALADLVRRGEVHPRELVELSLRRVEELDPRLNAFRVTMADEALAAATGDSLPSGPLAGVPIAVKDNQPLRGQPTTWGSRSFGPPAPADAEVVHRLRAAGAIPIGITNVPELTIFPWTASDANGVTHNPWDLTRTPGGSSGGSAAAVAAGLVPCATGSDGGGSIRIPAAACGLVGMKPSRGRVSMAPWRDGWLGLSVQGGLARTVRDSALMLDAMHGAIDSDADHAPPFDGSYVEACDRAPRPLRIAMSKRLPPGLLGKLSSEQRDAWERTGRLLESLGHHVSHRNPAYGMAQLDFMQTWLRGIYEESLTIPDRSQLESLTRQMAGAGQRLVPGRRRASLLRKRPRTTDRILGLWAENDVLLTPALARTAIAAEGGYGKPAPVAIDIAGRFTPYTPVFNLTGQPAISLPAGIGSDGLPLAVQLVGRPGAEDLLFSLAAQIEMAAPWAERRPSVS